MKLKVRSNGSLQEFEMMESVNVMVLNESLKLEPKLDGEITPELIADCLNLICEVYDNQFTKNDLSRSLNYLEIIPLTDEIIHQISVNLNLSVGEALPEESRVVSLEDKRRAKGN